MTAPASVQIVPGDPPRFRDYAQIIAPSWLQRWWGQRFMYSLGIEWDAFTQATTDGVRARCPGAPDTPPDALAYIGRDRQLVRGALESDAGFADRCRTAFDAWPRAGSLEGVLRQIQSLYSPISVSGLGVGGQNGSYRTWCTITTTGGPDSYSAGDPTAWDWDGDPSKWSRAWWIIHVSSVTWPPANLGAVLILGASNWCLGLQVPKARVDDLQVVLARWKSAGTIAQAILTYDATWPNPAAPAGPNYPDGTWGNLHTWDGAVSKPSRYASARYLAPVA